MRVSSLPKLTSAWLFGVALLVAMIATAIRQSHVTRDAAARVAEGHEALAALDSAQAHARRTAGTRRGRARAAALVARRRLTQQRLHEHLAALDRATACTERAMWFAVGVVLVCAPLGYVGLVIDVRARRRAVDALAEQSITDALTGLLNRRGLEHLGAHALAHAARAFEPALLLYLDMNGFKPINDECGHAAGDAALRDAAAALRSVFREDDVIARVGGDEFVVVACDASPHDAALLASRIDDALRTRSWGDAPYAPRRLHASVGWSAFDPARPVDLAALVREADAAMYAVKHLARVA